MQLKVVFFYIFFEMAINQLIKECLNHGGIQKVADILGVSHQAVSKKITSNKQIDSVDFINAVCKVTGKPFRYFKEIDDYEISEIEVENDLYKNYYKKEYEASQIREQELVKRMKQKDLLISRLEDKINQLMNEINY